MGFLDRAVRVINSSDLILEILDARFPFETRNADMEKLVFGREKKLVLVLNKCDLVSKNFAQKTKKELGKDYYTVFVSGKKRIGIFRLRVLMGKISRGKNLTVGIVGYPNTGKSSIINALKGKAIARVSSKPGFTRGEQFVKISEKIKLIDCPGIIPFNESNELLLALIGAKNCEQIENIEEAAEKIIEKLIAGNPKAIEKEFGIKIEAKNASELLEEIALKKKKLLKGGLPDTTEAAKIIVRKWQKGELQLN